VFKWTNRDILMHLLDEFCYFFKVGTICDNLILPATVTVKIYFQEQKVARFRKWLQV
jgi:hypothetical protein